MRLTGVRAQGIPNVVFNEETGEITIGGEVVTLSINFLQDDGVPGSLERTAPEGWGTMDGPTKVAWAKAEVDDHLIGVITKLPYTEVFPNSGLRVSAHLDFEQLPGWASWTPKEAHDWVEDNVNSLADAKATLGEMARAIMLLRDIVLDR